MEDGNHHDYHNHHLRKAAMGGNTVRIQVLAKGGHVDVKGDAFLQAPIIIPFGYMLADEGKLYNFFYAKPKTRTLEIRFKTGHVANHILFEVDSSTGCFVQVHRGTAKTHVSGNAIAPRNRNDNYGGVGTLQEVCHTPAGGESGSVIVDQYRAGGAKAPGKVVSRCELILRPDMAYNIVAKADGKNTFINIRGIWYEKPLTT
jgi:hypothetical protein